MSFALWNLPVSVPAECHCAQVMHAARRARASPVTQSRNTFLSEVVRARDYLYR